MAQSHAGFSSSTSPSMMGFIGHWQPNDPPDSSTTSSDTSDAHSHTVDLPPHSFYHPFTSSTTYPHPQDHTQVHGPVPVHPHQHQQQLYQHQLEFEAGGVSVASSLEEPAAAPGVKAELTETALDQQNLLSLSDPLAYALVDASNSPGWTIQRSFAPSPLPLRTRRRSRTIDSASLPNRNRQRNHGRETRRTQTAPYPSPSPRLGYSDSEVSNTMSHHGRGMNRPTSSQSGNFTPGQVAALRSSSTRSPRPHTHSTMQPMSTMMGNMMVSSSGSNSGSESPTEGRFAPPMMRWPGETGFSMEQQSYSSYGYNPMLAPTGSNAPMVTPPSSSPPNAQAFAPSYDPMYQGNGGDFVYQPQNVAPQSHNDLQAREIDRLRAEVMRLQVELASTRQQQQQQQQPLHSHSVPSAPATFSLSTPQSPGFSASWAHRTALRIRQFCSPNRAGNTLCSWHEPRREIRAYPPRAAPPGYMNCGCSYEEALFEESLARHGVGSYLPGGGVRLDPVVRRPLLQLLERRYGYKDGDFERDPSTGEWTEGEGPGAWEEGSRQRRPMAAGPSRGASTPVPS